MLKKAADSLIEQHQKEGANAVPSTDMGRVQSLKAVLLMLHSATDSRNDCRLTSLQPQQKARAVRLRGTAAVASLRSELMFSRLWTEIGKVE